MNAIGDANLPWSAGKLRGFVATPIAWTQTGRHSILNWQDKTYSSNVSMARLFMFIFIQHTFVISSEQTLF